MSDDPQALIDSIMPTCSHCHKTYHNQSNLARHLKDEQCPVLYPDRVKKKKTKTDEVTILIKHLIERQDAMEERQNKRIDELISSGSSAISNSSSIKPTINNINNTSNINNQNLNVLCLTPKDDLLEILTQSVGLKQALTYVKNCALARASGDCRFIERMYIDIPKPVLMYGNKSKTQFVYIDENQKRVVETNAKVIAKMLADNLQRSYLKGSSSLKDSDNELITVKSDHPYLPVVEQHDLDMWNSHIYELQDQKYQKKLLSSIRIPFEADV